MENLENLIDSLAFSAWLDLAHCVNGGAQELFAEL
jgi:hypothetical protein